MSTLCHHPDLAAHLAHKGLQATANGVARWLDKHPDVRCEPRWLWCRVHALRARASAGADIARLRILFDAALAEETLSPAQKGDLDGIASGKEAIWEHIIDVPRGVAAAAPPSSVESLQKALNVVGGRLWTDAQWQLADGFESPATAAMVLSAARALTKITDAGVRNAAYAAAVTQTGMLAGRPACVLAGMEVAKAAKHNWWLRKRASAEGEDVGVEQVVSPAATAALRARARGKPLPPVTLEDLEHWLLAASAEDTSKLCIPAEFLSGYDHHGKFLKLWPRKWMHLYATVAMVPSSPGSLRERHSRRVASQVRAIGEQKFVSDAELGELAVREYFKEPAASGERTEFCSELWRTVLRQTLPFENYEAWVDNANDAKQRAGLPAALDIVANTGAGECFFLSMVQARDGVTTTSSAKAQALRLEVCEWMTNNLETIMAPEHIRFKTLIRRDELDNLIHQRETNEAQYMVEYIDKMRKSATYAGTPEIYAAAELLQRPICVFKKKKDRQMMYIMYPSTCEDGAQMIYVAFSGEVTAGHYEWAKPRSA